MKYRDRNLTDSEIAEKVLVFLHLYEDAETGELREPAVISVTVRGEKMFTVVGGLKTPTYVYVKRFGNWFQDTIPEVGLTTVTPVRATFGNHMVDLLYAAA